MMLRIMVDECLGRDFVESLRGQGHDVVWAKEAMPNASDRAVLAQSFDDGRIVISEDYDFGDLVVRERMGCVGVVIVAGDQFAERTRDRNVRVADRITRLAGSLAGYLTIIEPNRARQRRLAGPDVLKGE